MRYTTLAKVGIVLFWGSVVADLHAGALSQDRGAAGAWQKILKLTTTASLLHTTAHPDDEHGDLLAWLSRGNGVRTSVLTLTRGEAGDNAIGSELFDGLGLIRTEELELANRYYGLDEQYYTTATDYGYSKRLDEALEKWDRASLLGEMVHVIRLSRPLVVISRFQGNRRDGHGHHQAAGLLTQEAVRAAGDPERFPQQIAAGLRPWQVRKLYIGGVREDESWSVRVDTGEYSPWLGDSYRNFSRIGLSLQRSQTAGRFNPSPGQYYRYYQRVDPPASDARESGFFDGIDVSLAGLFTMLGEPAPSGAMELLEAIDIEVRDAIDTFDMRNPAAAVQALARGLDATRRALARFSEEPEVTFLLGVKEKQFMDAIAGALGIELQALALPMGPVVPGQTFNVEANFTNRSSVDLRVEAIELAVPSGWKVGREGGVSERLAENETLAARFTVQIPEDAAVWRPHFSRRHLSENRYKIDESVSFFRPMPSPMATVVARYSVDGVATELRETVRRRESSLPYGFVMRELEVLPAIGVNVKTFARGVPLERTSEPIPIEVELLNNRDGGTRGVLELELPAGWSSVPTEEPFQFSRAGERRLYHFLVSMSEMEASDYEIRAVASSGGHEFREGYDIIRHRDLETRYLYHDAVTRVRGIDVRIAPGLSVGYVMGVGDQVPAGIEQLGALVQPLEESDLASGDLQQFDVIMTGTRAYAVREDLRTHNQRLLDYVREGGNLIVLYNTPELVPEEFAPFAGVLPRRSEEVSEEDSPVEILAPEHPVFNRPNRIGLEDFDGWVEQRGSKFWSEWDGAYTPMLSSHDTDQEPQRGGWLWARYGKGHYTYFAYALHRQLPYAVPGAYRILANLLCLGN